MTRTVFLFVVLLLAVAAAPGQTVLPPLAEVIAKAAEADAVRSAALISYTATRRYTLVNERFKKRAAMTVRIRYDQPGQKSFEMVSQEGSGLLCDRVLKRLIKTEQDASHADNRQLSHINSTNYKLRVIGTETLRDRLCYVLELVPLSKSPFLVRGKAWIDASDYAVARVQGVLAKKPSIWVGSTNIIQDYAKQGQFWLPSASLSSTDAPIFGRTDLRIESTGYDIRPAPAQIQHSDDPLLHSPNQSGPR